MKHGEPRCLVPQGDWCGEAATWSAEEQALFWVDINRFLIHRLDWETGATRSWFFGEPVTALSLTTDPERLLVAQASKLVFWWPGSDRREDFGFDLPDHPTARFNDGRSDPQGRFWVGSMGNNVGTDGEPRDMPASPDGRGHGRLYSIASGERPVEWRRDIGIANTFCWSPGGRTLYTGDTIAGELRAYAVDPATGAIADERPFFAGFDRGHPDGSAIDEQGHLYNCRYGGGCIVRVDPEGRIERIIEMPVKNITTATFGGPDLTTLLVTTSSLGRAAGDRLAGGLFAIETDVRGLPENRFAL